MNCEAAEKIANAVLYEGYMLYPYRMSAIKNRQRWNFGTLYPPAFEEVRRGTERSALKTELLWQGSGAPRIAIRARFLQFGASAEAGEGAVERSIGFDADLSEVEPAASFSFPGCNGGVTGAIRARAQAVTTGVFKLHMELQNEAVADPAAERDAVLPHSFVSAHLLIEAESGTFISLLDPPEELKNLVAGCRNEGCFPVLVGEEGRRNLMLCSPIILYDYPQVAPESAGDFFDGTEMDEMLTLRVTTMTGAEKEEMRSADQRTRQLLERTEQTAREQLMRTHGVIRGMRQL